MSGPPITIPAGEGTRWPNPEVFGEAQWRARYAPDMVTHADLLVMASACATLAHLLDEDVRAEDAVRCLRRGRRAWREYLEGLRR